MSETMNNTYELDSQNGAIQESLIASGAENRERNANIVMAEAAAILAEKPEAALEVSKALETISAMNQKADEAESASESRSFVDYIKDKKANMSTGVKRTIAVGSAVLAFAGAGLAVNSSAEKVGTEPAAAAQDESRDTDEAESARDIADRENDRENVRDGDRDNNKVAAWRKTKTVEGGVSRMHSDSTRELKNNIHSIFDARAKQADHDDGMMSQLDKYTSENISADNMAEGVAFSAKGDRGYRQGVVNALNGRPATARTNATRKENLRYIERAMTAEDTRYVMDRVTGSFVNHGETVNDEIFAQDAYLSNVRVMKMQTKDGREVIFKAGGGSDGNKKICINILQRKNSAPETSTSTSTSTTTTTTETRQTTPSQDRTNKDEETPERRQDSEDNTQKDDSSTGKPDRTPETTTETTPEEETSTREEETPEKAEEKVDDEVIPGTQKDPNAGDQWGEGNAPATSGDTPHSEVYQPQEPAPAPAPPSSVTEGRPPAETGTGPAVVDPNGSATVPGTNNNQGQGGSVDPSNQ